ncbi:MAG: transglutaminase family protein [Spirulinaceae cyanobacterium]
MNQQQYLHASKIIDWQHPSITKLAQQLANNKTDVTSIAQSCFEWVRDQILHSYDYQKNPVTCRASEVLAAGTGYCYAKSHLLAALLRANSIPAGLCYQRLSINDDGKPYSLHGLNAVYLPKIGWYRLDPRGNKPGVNAQFNPPEEQLAFKIKFPQEADSKKVFAEPLELVVKTLETYQTYDEVLRNLPDLSLVVFRDL